MDGFLSTGQNVIDPDSKKSTILCFSHLRWNFVYQRPQHLLTRAAAHSRVFFIEEPVFENVKAAEFRLETQQGGVVVATPVVPAESSSEGVVDLQRALIDKLIAQHGIQQFTCWYYTPMAILFTDHLKPDVTIYDCMDQLSAFQGAPPAMIEQEERLFAKADVVFTGGRSLYEAKKSHHSNVHAFPSSVDFAHFAKSRKPGVDPADQAGIPHPRIGFFGVLDERLDRDLLRDIAQRTPDYHYILLGPVVKISERDLPMAANIHYLGKKSYDELPSYIAHWDLAMMPFALNESTRFISPTKTPEYLAAGKRVVSTPIHDVVEPYGRLGFASIAANADQFCAGITELLNLHDEDSQLRVDAYLAQTSWDKTFKEMWAEVVRSRTSNTSGSKEVFASV